MIVLLRVWGETAPEFSYWFSQSWAIGFVGFFGFLFFVRSFPKFELRALDSFRPILLQSLVISFLYGLNYTGISTSNPHVEGPVQVVIAQSPLFFNVIFSVFIFKRIYSLAAWFGAILVLAGVASSSIIPVLISGSTSSTSTSDLGWMFVYFLGMIPLGILPIFFEGFYKAKSPVDGRTVTLEWNMFWTNLLLVLWLILFLPMFIALKDPPLDEFGENTKYFVKCVFAGESNYPDDNCGTAWWVLWLTVNIVSSMQTHSQILMSKQQSGVFATLALTMSPYIADLIFPLQFIMGPYTEIPSKWDILGAACCMTGVVIFGWSDHVSMKHIRPVNEVQLAINENKHETQEEPRGWYYLPWFVGRYQSVQESAIIRWFCKEKF